jgi:putative methionine-R-sulfoxide reductase with GAF domain
MKKEDKEEESYTDIYAKTINKLIENTTRDIERVKELLALIQDSLKDT